MESDRALFIKVSLQLYKECLVKASRSLVQGWPLLPGSVVLYFIFKFSSMLFGPLGIVGGFLMGFIQIALISLYYSWLHQLYQEKRLTLPEMLQFNAPLFMNIIGAAFLLWIALLILQSLFKGMQLDWLISIVSFVIVIVFNALPEVIYIEREDGAAALIAAANFTRNNWIEWFLPFLLILAPLLLISPTLVLVLLPRSEVLLPVLTILQGWELIGTLSGIFESLTISIPGIITIDPGTLLCLIPASWLMLFRGQLYSELARGSRRSRIYRMKQR